MSAKTLRPYQEELIAGIRGSLRQGHRRVLAQAVTGAGKTVIASYMLRSAYERGLRATFVVPSISLINQTIERLAEDGFLDVGVMQASHEQTDASRPVQVASHQTLARRKLPESNLVIIDEAHSHPEFYTRWMNLPEWKDIPFIGFSATPWTRGLGKHYTDLVQGWSLQRMIDAGYLSPFRAFAPSHPDLSSVRIQAGDFHEGDLSTAMSQGGLTADIVDNWIKHGEGRPTLCFCVDRKHAALVQQQFLHAGVNAGYIDAFTPPDERRLLQRQFESGLIDVICNVGVLTTGVDWDVRCIILARPTRSEALFVQIIGRGLRTAKGKEDCLIFDHADNHLRLGFVTSIQHNELDKGEKKKPEREQREREEAKPKECPKCKFLKPPKIKLCPSCGFEAQVKSKIECEDGELVEITPGGKKKREYTHDEKQHWYSMLLHHSREKGYKHGWVSNKYRERFGVWPMRMLEQPTPPTDEFRRFMQHLNIKSAFTKKREPA
jgi:superfamily II DNA or RNA helicase